MALLDSARPRWSGRLGLLDQAGSTFQASKRFWSFVQFSKFLPRNSVRVSASGGSSQFAVFRNPQYNGITAVFLNPSHQPAAGNSGNARMESGTFDGLHEPQRKKTARLFPCRQKAAPR